MVNVCPPGVERGCERITAPAEECAIVAANLILLILRGPRMSQFRRYDPPSPLLIGYDPFRDLPLDHLARLVEEVVEDTVTPPQRERGVGQPPYDPRLCVKVLVYSYCIGVRSSRAMERHCQESLPYLYLTRGEAPSYRTLCTARTQQGAFVEAVWLGLFSVAASCGIERLGRITVDSTKLRANASPEAVVKQEEYAALRQELERIQAEIQRIDAQEEAEGSAGRTRTGKTVPREHMRDILRRVRRQQREARQNHHEPPPAGASESCDGVPTLPLDDLPAPAPPEETEAEAAPEPQGMSRQMLQQISDALKALQEAEAEGRKHLCLTDPDARMMYGERHRGVREGHSFEVAADNGLLVAAEATQEPHDHERLLPLVEAAAQNEPNGVQAVDGDCGYYRGETVAALRRAGIDTCIPDSSTAGDLHRGLPIGTTQNRTRGKVPFTYDAAEDAYHCPEGNRLSRTQRRRAYGQNVTVYRAEQPCTDCVQRSDCLTKANAQHRTLKVGDDHELLAAARQRFAEPAHQERYRHRAEQVETIFGFLRGTLGFTRWWLRGAEKVAAEAKLFKTAYQFRKVHKAWAG